MTITLSDETQKRLEEWMTDRHISDFNEALCSVLMVVKEYESQFDVDRTPDTLAAIQEGLADARAGRSRPWAEFKKEWLAKYSQY